jgi:acetyltransferase-like isoleucine patch superfamily enzyme
MLIPVRRIAVATEDCLLRYLLRGNRRLTFGTELRVRGWPIIDVHPGAKVIIGCSVTLNSRNRGYHINMHSGVKLMADRAGAQIVIGDRTRIHGTCIHAYKSITIGRNCLIAANTQMFDGSGHDLCLDNPGSRIQTTGDSDPIVVEDNVWIGANCIILPGVHIGEGSVVAAGSVVTKNIPSFALAGGNPARVLSE